VKKSLRVLGAAAAVAGLSVLAGCSGATDPAGAGSSESAADLSAEARAARDIVDAAAAPTDEFTPPGPPVDGSAIAGKTVFFIPATLQVPSLSGLADLVTDAFSNVDATVQVCDAKANPADAASCLAQAVDSGAAAVITSGFPREFAPAGFDAVTAAGIPLVNTLTETTGDGDPAQIGYVSYDSPELQSWMTNWVIADSDAKANVLAIKVTDTPSTTAWADLGIIQTYDEKCADCSVEVLEINTGQYDRLPSLVSSALVANPDITYVQSEFDSALPAISQGIQSAARDDMKVVSVDGYLSTLQDLGSGRLVQASAAADYEALSWYIADAAVRLVAGSPAVQDLDFPFLRAFTAENVGELDLTPEGEASGAWFGDADYQAGFLELWGIQG
jgi:ribose transport system substrate-binding protein